MHGIVEDTFSKDLGKEIKKARKQLGMTQNELAIRMQLMGVESSCIRVHRIESGAFQITACEAFIISQILFLNLDDRARAFVNKITV